MAREAGLSVASVSRVLNGHSNVHPDSRAKVQAAMATLGYRPNAAARSLSTSRTHAIGVVLPDLHGEFFGEMVRGMDRAASEHGYMLLLSTMHADKILAGQALGAMNGRVDGVIVMAPELTKDDLASALPGGLPAVLVNSPDDVDHHNIRIDNRAGVMLMVRHLLASGRKRIVHLSGDPKNLDAAERSAAFADALAALAPDLPVRVMTGDFSDESGERLVQQLLAEGADFDAIFAANDMMAMGALQALRTVGISVPRQVAVSGFDDVPLARYLGLTTLKVDMVGIGRRAVEQLVAGIADQGDPPALQSLMPTLVVRGTTAAS
ncbi:MAG: LacI family DNA-binding transcriptional regulator [Novosphingobium sp.]